MNFLIISSPRCGSTSLQKSISNSYNLKIIYEPYSPWGLHQKDYKLKNVVVNDDAFKYVEAIIHSMTPKERSNPSLINPSRKARIAKGCGRPLEEVNKLMKQFDQTRQMMKMFTNKNQMAAMMKQANQMKGLKR